VTTDREAITDLVYAYAERIDVGDFEGVADLFAEAELTFEGFTQGRPGREKILAMYEASTRRYDDGTPKTKHVMTNVVVEVGDDRRSATARTYFTVLQAVPGVLSLQPIIAGRYRDAFTHTDGSWRFSHRHMLVDLVGDLSQHMLGDVPDLS
jgi:3-phenylpropionate/cinnamic acid dioxygenase small subunit